MTQNARDLIRNILIERWSLDEQREDEFLEETIDDILEAVKGAT